MSILTKEDRKDLVYSCRKALLEHVDCSGILTESTRAAARHFILNEASYQDLLNLVYNPNRDTQYLDTEVLEHIAVDAYANHLNESKGSVFGAIEENAGTALAASRARAGAAKDWLAKKGGQYLRRMKGEGIRDSVKAVRDAAKAGKDSDAYKQALRTARRKIGGTAVAYTGTAAGGYGVYKGSKKGLKALRDRRAAKRAERDQG